MLSRLKIVSCNSVQVGQTAVHASVMCHFNWIHSDDITLRVLSLCYTAWSLVYEGFDVTLWKTDSGDKMCAKYVRQLYQRIQQKQPDDTEQHTIVLWRTDDEGRVGLITDLYM